MSDKTDEHGLSRKVAVPYRSFIARDPIFHLFDYSVCGVFPFRERMCSDHHSIQVGVGPWPYQRENASWAGYYRQWFMARGESGWGRILFLIHLQV